jgi:hypothetical protein
MNIRLRCTDIYCEALVLIAWVLDERKNDPRWGTAMVLQLVIIVLYSPPLNPNRDLSYSRARAMTHERGNLMQE